MSLTHLRDNKIDMETIVDMEIRYPINEDEVLLELKRELRVRKLDDLI